MTLTFNRSINADGSLLYFTDATAYGGLNPSRNSIGIVALAIFKKSSGDIQVQPAAYLGETVLSFAFDVLGKDGVWDVKFWGMPLFTGQILANGDIVFDAGEHQVKKMLAGALTTIPVSQLLNEATLHTGGKKALVSTELLTKRDDLHLIKLQKQEEYATHSCELHDLLKAKNNYDYTRSLHVGACIDFKRGNIINAQLKTERGIEFASKALAAAA